MLNRLLCETDQLIIFVAGVNCMVLLVCFRQCIHQPPAADYFREGQAKCRFHANKADDSMLSFCVSLLPTVLFCLFLFVSEYFCLSVCRSVGWLVCLYVSLSLSLFLLFYVNCT